MVEFVNLEFGAHGFLINHVFLPTEQAETNMSQLVRLEGKHSTQNAHCALSLDKNSAPPHLSPHG